jgi:phage baseplate assembly protein W
MIPSTTAFLEQDFEITEQPTHTYKMNLESNLIRGYTDGQEAMKQAIYKILNTERYQYVMYSWNYGIELLDLYGEPVSYVCPELERRITEALTWDDRIQSVDNFEFNISKKGEILVTFTAHTVFGNVVAEKVVNF